MQPKDGINEFSMSTKGFSDTLPFEISYLGRYLHRPLHSKWMEYMFFVERRGGVGRYSATVMHHLYKHFAATSDVRVMVVGG